MGESMHPGLLPWYAAGSVSPEEAREIAAHLENCESCREELENLRSLGATLQAEAALDLEVFASGERAAPSHREPRMARWMVAAAMLVVGLAIGIVGSRIITDRARGAALEPFDVVRLTSATRSGDGVPELRGPGPWALVISLPGTASLGRYDVWLEDEAGLQVGDPTIGIIDDPDGAIGFHLEPLPAGIYTVVLSPLDNDTSNRYRYALRIPQARD